MANQCRCYSNSWVGVKVRRFQADEKEARGERCCDGEVRGMASLSISPREHC